MKLILISVILVLLAETAYGAKLVVVGSDDGLPVAGATMLSNSGRIVGITDNRGCVELPVGEGYPLTLRSLGYEVLTVAGPADTVILRVAEYALPEVSVIASGRPVRRVVWYSREYSTGTAGTDSMQLYSEYMLESFVADRKVKGYHSSDSKLSIKAIKRLARISGAERADSVFIPGENDDITLLAWGSTFCKLPEDKTEETIAVRNGSPIDSLEGKYATARVFHKNGNRYVVMTDMLSGHKNHSWSPSLFKLFGMTIDINQYKSTLCFQQNEQGVYDVYDLLYSSVNLDIIARGKMFRWIFRSKEPLRMNTYIELYPVDITAHTIEEYKEMRKSRESLEFRCPESVLPEIPVISNLKSLLSKPIE